jgi:hypothetical protein
MFEFRPFPKIPRYYRETIITEKIDGTNAQIVISALLDQNTAAPEEKVLENNFALGIKDGFCIYAGSRNRYLTPQNDNYGFASWVQTNHDQLLALGRGQHFGEWWGRGIGRNYGLTERRFSLFNTNRWKKHPGGIPGESYYENPREEVPDCCHVVPVLGTGNDDGLVMDCLDILIREGSKAAPGFMNPEGIIIYHSAANSCFKVTLENDDQPKGKKGG